MALYSLNEQKFRTKFRHKKYCKNEMYKKIDYEHIYRRIIEIG